GDADGFRVLLCAAPAGVALVVHVNLQAGPTQVVWRGVELCAVQRGVDGVKAAGEGHGRVGRAVAAGEVQACGLCQRKRAVDGRESDLQLFTPRRVVGDAERAAERVSGVVRDLQTGRRGDDRRAVGARLDGANVHGRAFHARGAALVRGGQVGGRVVAGVDGGRARVGQHRLCVAAVVGQRAQVRTAADDAGAVHGAGARRCVV